MTQDKTKPKNKRINATKRYLDKYGELWIKKGHYLIRLSDGTIGKWDNGKGLKVIPTKGE